MTLTMADSIRYIRYLFAKQNPTLLSWPICTSMDLMLIITPLETNARTLITTKYRRALPPRWERVGTKPPARLQLLREDSCVIKVTQNTPIYSRNKPLNCYHGRYTYRLISWCLRRLPCGQQVRPKRHLKRKWRFVISSRNMDMEDIRYTIRKGRYSDKQTIISDSGSHVTFRYRTDTRLVIDRDNQKKSLYYFRLFH